MHFYSALRDSMVNYQGPPLWYVLGYWHLLFSSGTHIYHCKVISVHFSVPFVHSQSYRPVWVHLVPINNLVGDHLEPRSRTHRGPLDHTLRTPAYLNARCSFSNPYYAFCFLVPTLIAATQNNKLIDSQTENFRLVIREFSVTFPCCPYNAHASSVRSMSVLHCLCSVCPCAVVALFPKFDESKWGHKVDNGAARETNSERVLVKERKRENCSKVASPEGLSGSCH